MVLVSPSEMAHTLWSVFLSIEIHFFLSLFLSLNSFCNETSRIWALSSSEARWEISVKRPWVQVWIWVTWLHKDPLLYFSFPFSQPCSNSPCVKQNFLDNLVMSTCQYFITIMHAREKVLLRANWNIFSCKSIFYRRELLTSLLRLQIRSRKKRWSG